MSKETMLAKLNEKQGKAIKYLREKLKGKAEEAVDMAATIGGGAAAGYIEANYPNKEFFGVNAGLAGGALAVVVGMMGWAGSQSPAVASVGTGMLAYEAGRRVARNVSAK
jgi:hypothetical protein